MHKQIFSWGRWWAILKSEPETWEKCACFQGVFLELKKEMGAGGFSCSLLSPGGMLWISGCLWKAGDSPGFIWFLCESGRNEIILTITHWAFHFIQICRATLKLVSGCAREKQKNKNTYYKSKLNVCTASAN